MSSCLEVGVPVALCGSVKLVEGGCTWCVFSFLLSSSHLQSAPVLLWGCFSHYPCLPQACNNPLYASEELASPLFVPGVGFMEIHLNPIGNSYVRTEVAKVLNRSGNYFG